MITTIPNLQFLGIYIHDSINWSCHIEYIIPKLSSACYIMRSIKPFVSLNTLKTTCCSMVYGLPFWGNSPHSLKLFRMQKRIIRIMIVCTRKSRVSYRNLFRRLEILPFVSQCILSLMFFMVTNKNLFILSSENHTKSTRQFNNLYQPVTDLTIYQRGVYNVGIKIFNNLPPYIKDISNDVRKFESCLKQFLHIHSFYSIEEYLQYKSITS